MIYVHCFSSNIFIVFHKTSSLFSSKSVQESFIVLLHIHQRKCSIVKRKHHIFWVKLLRFYYFVSTQVNNCRKFCKVIWCSSVNSSEFFYVHSSLQRSEFSITPMLNVYKDREEEEALWALQCCVIPEGLLWVVWATPYYFAKLPTVTILVSYISVKTEELDSRNDRTKTCCIERLITKAGPVGCRGLK